MLQKIKDDLKTAMKAGNSFEVDVLRMILASIHNKEIDKKSKDKDAEVLSDEEVIEVLSKEAKKRKEAVEIYTKSARSDLAEKEAKELELIKKYLPKEMPAEEIEKIVKAAIEKTGATSEKEFGLVMKEVMKDLSAKGGSASGGKGKADASTVSGIVKKLLG